MYKNFKKLFTLIFLILILTNSIVFGFHKNGNSTKTIVKNQGDKKKDYKIEYCTQDIVEKKKPPKKKTENDEEQDQDIEKEEKKTIFEINSYHSEKFKIITNH